MPSHILWGHGYESVAECVLFISILVMLYEASYVRLVRLDYFGKYWVYFLEILYKYCLDKGLTKE